MLTLLLTQCHAGMPLKQGVLLESFFEEWVPDQIGIIFLPCWLDEDFLFPFLSVHVTMPPGSDSDDTSLPGLVFGCHYATQLCFGNDYTTCLCFSDVNSWSCPAEHVALPPSSASSFCLLAQTSLSASLLCGRRHFPLLFLLVLHLGRHASNSLFTPLHISVEDVVFPACYSTLRVTVTHCPKGPQQQRDFRLGCLGHSLLRTYGTWEWHIKGIQLCIACSEHRARLLNPSAAPYLINVMFMSSGNTMDQYVLYVF